MSKNILIELLHAPNPAYLLQLPTNSSAFAELPPTAIHMIQRKPDFEKKVHIGYQCEILHDTYKSNLFQERSWR
jgi:hypothetical protein